MLSIALYTFGLTAMFAVSCVVLLAAFSASRVPFAVCCLMSIVMAVVALLYLKLWCKAFSGADYVADAISVGYGFVGFMVFVEEYDYQVVKL